jgi:rhodanese-related sulfurtransferase
MTGLRQVAIEALAVAVLSIVVALAANAVSPRGLRLGRDYFPQGEKASAPMVAVANDAGARLARLGFATVRAEEMLTWLRDPQYQAGLIVFVDARDDEKYRAAHIPGAWRFNHYRADEELPTVLPACLNGLTVVVYCSGGQCEDSEFAAIILRDAGVPRENLAVYVGGLSEWTEKKFPLEAGDRGSGEVPRARQP